VKNFTIFLLLILSFSGFAQSKNRPEKVIEKALQFRNQGDTLKAITILTKQNAKKPDVRTSILLAEIFFDSGFFKNAIDSYKSAIKIDSLYYPDALFFVADLSIKVGQYIDAFNYAKAFVDCRKETGKFFEQANRIIANSYFAINELQKADSIKPILLDTKVNSPLDEYWPSLIADESKLIITRLCKMHVGNTYGKQSFQEDFYLSEKDSNGVWCEPKPVININTNGNEGSQSISADGRYLFFTACNRPDGFGKCDIYMSEFVDNEWTKSVNVGYPVNSAYWEAQPSVSPDGRTVYFVSNRPDGYGGSDIWLSHKDLFGRWQKPENLGPSVNTKYDEWSPFIHSDGVTLYFSSEGHVGMGGVDVFVTNIINDTIINEPKNIGFPVNTFADEKGFVVNTLGDKGFFSTNTNRNSDIYSLQLKKDIRPLPSSFFKGVIVDDDNNNPIKANVELYEFDNGELLYKSFSNNGNFLFPLVKDKTYALNINSKGYLFFSENIKLNTDSINNTDSVKIVRLKPIRSGQQIVLNNILFEINSSKLLNESLLELGKLIELLNDNPEMQIQIHGHTDNVGNEKDNLILSENRARSVCQYLFDNGISVSRISSLGFGKLRPIASNADDYGRSLNRRIELFVVK